MRYINYLNFSNYSMDEKEITSTSLKDEEGTAGAEGEV